MSCAAIQEALVDQMLGEGSEADRARLAHHVRECPECARESERIRRTIGLLRTHAVEGEGESGAILEPARRAAVINEAGRRREPWWSYAAVAASLIVLVSGVLYQAQKPVGPVAPPPSVAQALPTSEPFEPTLSPPPSSDAREIERQRQIDALREEVERLKTDRAPASEPAPPRENATGAEQLDRPKTEGDRPPKREPRSPRGDGKGGNDAVPPSGRDSAAPAPGGAPSGVEARGTSGGPAPAPPPRGVPRLDLARPNTNAKAFVETVENPVSTFALDADTASYAIARTYQLHDAVPPPAARRIDEFVRSKVPAYADRPGKSAFTVHVDGAPSPFHPGYHLMRVGVKARASDDRKPLILTFAVDVSPYGRRIEAVAQSIELLMRALRDDDEIAIVVSGATPPVLLEATPVRRADAILDALHRLHRLELDAGKAALGFELGYLLGKRSIRANAISYVVLCTDNDVGQRTIGGRVVAARIAKAANEGIELLTLDFSPRDEESAVREVADKNGALYAHLVEPRSNARLLQDLPSLLRRIVARNAKARVDFDPARVERYRLIGSEKRTADDRVLWGKESGAIYAGHILTAWYEVKLTTVGGDLGRVQVRYAEPDRRPAQSTAPLAEEELAPTFLQTSDDFQLAAVVTHVGERFYEGVWLKDAPLIGLLAEANNLPPEIRRLPAVMEWARLVQVQVDESRRAK